MDLVEMRLRMIDQKIALFAALTRAGWESAANEVYQSIYVDLQIDVDGPTTIRIDKDKVG